MQLLKIFITLLVFLTGLHLSAQPYNDYLGAGHDNGITTNTSSNSNPQVGNNTINGNGILPDLALASRFLGQASLGADYETIQTVSQMGIENWIDNEMNTPPLVSFTDTTWMVWEHFKQLFVNKWGQNAVANAGDAVVPYWFFWKMSWWNNILKSDDHLRQRVAQAYSQIFVISEKSNLQLNGPGMASYYDMLYQHAFGNFRDILYDVTMHPCMGMYLSHMNNPKSDPVNNIHPDENYAREIMQLFSIGLVELNQDGTPMLDAQGNLIPTYDNNDIKEFAKIFTGLAPSEYYWPWYDATNAPVQWDNEYNYNPVSLNMWDPMIPFDNWHEPGPKTLLNGQVVPANQTTLEDINDAIDNLFNHPNVGPFIGRLLIQRLVKSNPTPEYIGRVSAVFANNGQGIRGDMEAVIKAILMDDEARDCSWIDNPVSGKLREPLLRYTQMLRAFNVSNQSNKLWNWGYAYEDAVSQGILSSPSVFNFYLPDFQPNGLTANQQLFGPEYQIHTSATSINFINFVYDVFINEFYGEIATQASNTTMNAPGYEPNELKPVDYLSLDLSDEMALANNPAALVDRLDILVSGGAFSQETKTSIINTLNQLSNNADRVKAALYLSFIAPDYSVQK